MDGARHRRGRRGKRLKARCAWAWRGGPEFCGGCQDRTAPPSPCTGCEQRDHAPETPEEAEAFRLLHPLPPLRVGAMGPIGLDAAEIRARVRPPHDPDLVVALCLAAEIEALDAFRRKKEDE